MHDQAHSNATGERLEAAGKWFGKVVREEAFLRLHQRHSKTSRPAVFTSLEKQNPLQNNQFIYLSSAVFSDGIEPHSPEAAVL